MENRGVGLSPSELDYIEGEIEARFPPDLRELLAESLPTGQLFPNWRVSPRKVMAQWRARLREGFLFDVQNNVWVEEWGPRPSRESDALELVSQLFAEAPALIPIHGHRGIPDEPSMAGNPVFSVVQTDVVVYGATLEEYLLREFGGASGDGQSSIGLQGRPERPIRFWTILTYA